MRPGIAVTALAVTILGLGACAGSSGHTSRPISVLTGDHAVTVPATPEATAGTSGGASSADLSTTATSGSSAGATPAAGTQLRAGVLIAPAPAASKDAITPTTAEEPTTAPAGPTTVPPTTSGPGTSTTMPGPSAQSPPNNQSGQSATTSTTERCQGGGKGSQSCPPP